MTTAGPRSQWKAKGGKHSARDAARGLIGEGQDLHAGEPSSSGPKQKWKSCIEHLPKRSVGSYPPLNEE